MDVDKNMKIFAKVVAVLATFHSFVVYLPPIIAILILSMLAPTLISILFVLISFLSLLVFFVLSLATIYHYAFDVFKKWSRFFKIYARIIFVLILISFLYDLIVDIFFRNPETNNFGFGFGLGIVGNIYFVNSILGLLVGPSILIVLFYYGWLKKPTETPISDIKTTENNSDSGLNLEKNN